jgi:hypothetical protein
MNETTTTDQTESPKLNPLIEWANLRPHWEKYIWRMYLEHGGLNEEEIQVAYRLFKIDNGILPIEEIEPIDLSGLAPPSSTVEPLKPLMSIKGIQNVNALQDGTEIQFGPKLTVCYGANGSGKSGYGRIIGSACFTRGERVIHPNLKADTVSNDPAKAEFVIGSDSDQLTISFTDGDVTNPILKRFSMFDSHSALIQLDKENILQFTPAQLAVFDKVNDVVQGMEALLAEERSQMLKANPLENSFMDQTSNVSEALLSPDLAKENEEILTFTVYPEDGDAQVEQLVKQREALVKQNLETEKKQLIEDKATLERFKSKLDTYQKNYGIAGIDKLNLLIKDVKDKKKLVAQLGIETFNDGIFKSTGNEKWEALLRAAKELYDNEVDVQGREVELNECLLCHQPLTDKEKTLFENYWEFLLSTAAKDLKIAEIALELERKRIDQERITAPQFGDDEVVIKVLHAMEQTELVNQLRKHLEKADATLLEWDGKIKSLNDVDNPDIPNFLASQFDLLKQGIDEKVSKLKDPKKDIEALDNQIIELQHRKVAASIVDKYEEYLAWRRWQAKADRLSMTGTKRNYTDERSTLFDAIVTDNYIRVFQEECQALRVGTDLQIAKRGSAGQTLVSKRLSFSSKMVPSEVLSEGEQKACAVADFLSEARLNPANWGIIFDDPVTSLDHERKEKIAERLVAQANERQVIVFTHDITFLLSLLHYAERDGVQYKRVTVRRVGESTGIADDRMPWVAENCKARKGILRNELQRISAMFNRGDHQNDIERAVKAWCELLRESWERAVEERVLQGTVERFRPSVQTTKLSKLSHLSDPTILSEVDAGMTESSKWVHDRSAWLNSPMTDDIELESYISRYEAFLNKCPIK